MVLMVAEDVRRVPQAQIEAAQTMGATRGEIVELVLLPAAKPALLDTLRITMGWAWTYLVVAELVAANSGLGYAILKAQRFLQTDKIFAGIILIGLIGLIIDQLFRWLHRKAFPWMHLKRERMRGRSASASSARCSASRRARWWRCRTSILDVGDNEFVTLVGASGCGKSTLLRIIGGLEYHTSGEVVVNGKPVHGPGADRAMVFQHYSLYPWLTVMENIRFCRRLKVNRERPHLVRRRGRLRPRRRPAQPDGPVAASPTPIRTSSPAACSSAWRSPGR